jgi:hypothetical protein
MGEWGAAAARDLVETNRVDYFCPNPRTRSPAD